LIAIRRIFAVARRHGYQSHLSFSDYTVFIARADRNKDSSGQYSPDIAVPAGQYAGGYYDQADSSMPPAWSWHSTLPPLSSPSMSAIFRISNIVRHEGEHHPLLQRSRSLFPTADHSRGAHPILQ
jgi:hypothetical protein